MFLFQKNRNVTRSKERERGRERERKKKNFRSVAYSVICVYFKIEGNAKAVKFKLYIVRKRDVIKLD